MHDSIESPQVGADLINSLMPVAQFIERSSLARIVSGEEFKLVNQKLSDVFPSVFSSYAKDIVNGAHLVTVTDLLAITSQLDVAGDIVAEYTPDLSKLEREQKIKLFDDTLKDVALRIESNAFFHRYSKFTLDCCFAAMYLSYNLTFMDQINDLDTATEDITEAAVVDLMESISVGKPFSANCQKVLSGLMLQKSASDKHNDALRCIDEAMRSLEAFRESKC